MICAINIVVPTQNNVKYTEVAITKFPLIVECDDVAELEGILCGEEFTAFVQQLVVSPKVYANAKVCVKFMDESQEPVEWHLDEFVPIMLMGN